MAVIQAGFPRATGDIDLLIDISPANQERVRRALMKLPVLARSWYYQLYSRA